MAAIEKKNEATTTPAPKGRLEMVAVKDIVDSKTNPRGNVGDVSDLVASVKAKGVLEPICVRKIGVLIECVFGWRRLTAAKKVGLTHIPAIVREGMTDEEVLEEQIIENRDRSDVHPLDEAQAYANLLAVKRADGSERTVEDVAARCGVDPSKVYRRLALLGISKAGRVAFREGRLEASVAGLIARIKGANLQDRAVEELAAPSDGTRGPVPYRTALDHVRRVYMLRLADASFDVKDATLIEGCPACQICTKRTGSNRSLFGDIEDKDDLCTDAACHAKKTDAAWQRKAKAAEAEGKKVLDARACREVFKYGSTEPSTESGFVRLDSPCPDDPKGRTYRQILGSKVPEVTLGRDEFGASHDLADRKITRKMVIEALPSAQRREIEGKDQAEADAERAEREEEERRDVFAALVDTLNGKIEEIKPAALRVLALGLTETGARLTRATWKLDDEDREKRLAKMTGADLARVVVCAAVEKMEGGAYVRGEASDAFGALLKAYSVDEKKIRDEVRKPKAEPAPKAKK